MDYQTPCIQDSVTRFDPLRDDYLTPIHLGKRSLYGAQVTGGSDIVRYFVSGNLENERGALKMPEFAQERLDSLGIPIRDEWMYPAALQQMNVRANLQATVSPKLDLSVNAGFVQSHNRIAQTDNNSLGVWSSARENPGFSHAGLGYTDVGVLGEDAARVQPVDSVGDLPAIFAGGHPAVHRVDAGKLASVLLDAERGDRSGWISPIGSRRISAG